MVSCFTSTSPGRPTICTQKRLLRVVRRELTAVLCRFVHFRGTSLRASLVWARVADLFAECRSRHFVGTHYTYNCKKLK